MIAVNRDYQTYSDFLSKIAAGLNVIECQLIDMNKFTYIPLYPGEFKMQLDHVKTQKNQAEIFVDKAWVRIDFMHKYWDMLSHEQKYDILSQTRIIEQREDSINENYTQLLRKLHNA